MRPLGGRWRPPSTDMSPVLCATLVAVLYVLHQDIWFWRTARPLVFGFLPIGLAYHAAFTLASSLLLAVLVRYAWPSHLETAADPGAPPE
jgi:hypothetical protein